MVDQMISVTDAAKVKGCHDRTIRFAIRRGEIRAEKVGKTWSIDPDSLARWWPKEPGKYERKRKAK